MNNKKYDGVLYTNAYVGTIKDFIVRSSEVYADRAAYMYKDKHDEAFKSITYADFKQRLDELGTALIDMGLKGSNISVIGENSYRWVLSYFTIACGVGTVVPLDKNLEIGEIINLMSRADVELIFASPKMADKVVQAFDEVDTLRKMVLMDGPYDDLSKWEDDDSVLKQSDLLKRGRELLDQGSREYVDAEVKPEDLSTILYTSGTTGLAKGVKLSHMNLTQNVFSMSKYVDIPTESPETCRVLDVLPMHHAYEMTCSIMTTYYQGGTIVVCEGLKHMMQNFKEAGCAIMLGVPLIFETIYRRIWKQAEKSGEAANLRRGLAISKKLGLRNNKTATRKMFAAIHSIFGPNLYLLIAGGAAIDPKVIEDFEAMGIPMIQGYGMTENAPIIAVNQDRYSKAASVGKPMPGTEVRIIDKDDRGIGEVICKGPSVMMGYYNDPEATADAIRDGWLYTGDYGYFDEDGFLYLTGRKKNVIVTKGGKNIFPEEVEYYLLLDDHILEAIVYGKHEPVKDDLICTAIVYPDYKLLAEEGVTEPADIYKVLSKAVDTANAKMPPYKRIKRLEIRKKDFIKTTTLKIKRFEKENFEYDYDDQDFNKNKRF